jgi:putative membrane protein
MSTRTGKEKRPGDHTARRETLLELPPRELLLHGVVENRGLALILAAVAFVFQIDPIEEAIVTLIVDRIPFVSRAWEAAQASFARGGVPIEGVLLAIAGLIVVALFIRVLSAASALLRLFDYRLLTQGEDLRVEYGLFTRVVATIPIRRIQSVSMPESLLHRAFGRVAVRVATAGGSATGDASRVEREWIAPIVQRDRVPALLEAIQPGLDFDVEWHPAHPKALLRTTRVAFIGAAVVGTGSRHSPAGGASRPSGSPSPSSPSAASSSSATSAGASRRTPSSSAGAGCAAIPPPPASRGCRGSRSPRTRSTGARGWRACSSIPPGRMET